MGRNAIKVIMIKKILKMALADKLTRHKITRLLSVPRSTVRDYINRAEKQNLTWEIIAPLSDDELRQRLFPTRRKKTEPEWHVVHKSLQRKGVRLHLLWEEYCVTAHDHYCYSEFCKRYRAWCKTQKIWLPHNHVPGECLYVDYAGMTLNYYDSESKSIRSVQIFVAAFGASNYIYCEATNSQSLAHWIGSHVRAFEFFGGVPLLLIPDNLKSGVTTAHRYDPKANSSYEAMAFHYGITILPARSASPKDKAKVENAVQQVERRILAKLRDQQFFSLEEINEAISPLLIELLQRQMKQYKASREELFLNLDKPALKPLPPTPYEFSTWNDERVNGGYHIRVNDHFYSVPHRLIGNVVQVKVNEKHVEVFFQQERIALHLRDDTPYQYTTENAHRPRSHQEYLSWNTNKILLEALRIGKHTHALISDWLNNAVEHKKRVERRAVGVIRLEKRFTASRLEAAAQRANQFKLKKFQDIELMLKNGLDNSPLPEGEKNTVPQDHAFIRGADYYDNDEDN